MSARFLVAERVDCRLFACIAEAHFTAPEVSSSRLGASLRPFPDEDCAIAALRAAGGENVRALG